MNNFQQLDSDAFTVLPDFLSGEEIQILLADYHACSLANNKNYGIAIPTKKAIHSIFAKIQKVMQDVTEHSNTKVDMLTSEAMYTDNSKHVFEWHQDHESYFVFREVRNYLNFFIPLLKKDPLKSGLSVVPLSKIIPFTSKSDLDVVNRGALAFYPYNGKTRIVDSDNDIVFDCDFDIDSLAITPEISAGDLLLLRGDAIHKTQDSVDQRIAISVRCVDSNMMLAKEQIFGNMNERKKKFMLNNQRWYSSINQTFGDQAHRTAKDIFMKYSVDFLDTK